MRIGFTIDQASGAWPNGSLVRKTNSEPKDVHGDGALARILGSLGPGPDIGPDHEPLPGTQIYFYFVEWLDTPGIPVGIKGTRLEKVG